MNRSIPTNTTLEFLNITSINDQISRCEIKILYAGKNRNKSFISKMVAEQMAATLPGIPIVGEFISEKEDFGDHGSETMVVDSRGVVFEKSTRPYGFVPLDAKIWWQTFIDGDGVEREYLLTEGYLWTGRYPESNIVIERGGHHSMELDPSSLVGQWKQLSGEWAIIDNSEEEYFIINSAAFSALCILGENVEPCFEGSNITRDSNLVFSLSQNSFKEEMDDFMAELKTAMANYSLNKGGVSMSKKDLENFAKDEDEKLVDHAAKEEEDKKEEEDFAKSEDEKDEDEFAKSDDKEKDEDEFAKSEDEKDKEDKEDFAKSEDEKDKEDKEDFVKSEDEKDKEEEDEFAKSDEEKDSKCEDDDEEDKEDYAKLYSALAKDLLSSEYKLKELSAKYEALKTETESLREFKASVEDAKKDEMINSFYMLSAEDKAEVVANKSNFSLDEIEAKLSVICVRNKVNFDLEDTSKKEDTIDSDVLTYNVNAETASNSPAWLKAVERVVKNKK